MNNMKKKIFFALPFVAAFLFAACDTKACYCYETDSQGKVHEQVVYANPSTPCNSYGNSSRGCIESYERDRNGFNPGEVAK